MKKIWLRVGMTVEVSEEQYNELENMSLDFCGNYRDVDAPDWLIDLVEDKGKCDGDCYIPLDVFAENDWEDCSISKEQIEELKALLTGLLDKGTSIRDCVGYIYGLYQDYQLSEDQEMELYMFVDPDELWNEPSEYWRKQDDNPLIDYLNGMEVKYLND